jgi:pyruvate/2-oxoglutarate dehydrogenase complex dihydrolipoamide dehydrogenase (E3) component
MTGDQSYHLVVIGIGTAGREFTATRKEAGNVKKMI